jgi:hypothetical protein
LKKKESSENSEEERKLMNDHFFYNKTRHSWCSQVPFDKGEFNGGVFPINMPKKSRMGSV